mgnify:CR=1 FL=1
MSNNFSVVLLHFNKSIMLSITCFCEYFNLSYTRGPVWMQNHFFVLENKPYMAIGQNKINSILSTTGD